MGGPRHGTPGMARSIDSSVLRFSCLHCDWSLFTNGSSKDQVRALVDIVVLHLSVLHDEGWPEETVEAAVRTSQRMFQDARTVR